MDYIITAETYTHCESEVEQTQWNAANYKKVQWSIASIYERYYIVYRRNSNWNDLYK